MFLLGDQTFQLHLLFIVALDFSSGKSISCVFDDVRQTDLKSVNIDYTTDLRRLQNEKLHARKRRELGSLDDLYQPIRIFVHFAEMELRALEKEELQETINKTVALIKNIFSVMPVSNLLLLGRTGCRQTYHSGVNSGRCSSIRRGYEGEYCTDEFKIPDDHLEELELWNSTWIHPIKTCFQRGRGVVETDYILYVNSVSSVQCSQAGLNVIAYATYCQLDQNGRPVSGYINICPQMMKENSSSRNKVTVTVLHELFHALGFSSDLFSKFKRCHKTANGSSVNCRPLNRPVRTVDGVLRLVTKRVSELTSEHLNCRSNQQNHSVISNFGPIIQQTKDGEIQSHWDAAFMHGSLMMPTISQPHQMTLDKITLAVFEDSGWYRVNYEYAEDFFWGKGQGCDFGLSSRCQQETSEFFCQQRSRGCHFLHKDKGTCNTNPFLHGCHIYDSKPEDNCQLFSLGVNSHVMFGESFGSSSRCFLSNLTQWLTGDDITLHRPSYPEGRCFRQRCNATGHLFLEIEGNWYNCPDEAIVEIPNLLGIIQCPKAKIICPEFRQGKTLSMSSLMEQASASSFYTTLTSDPNRGNRDNLLKVELQFDSLPSFSDGNSELKDMVMERIRLCLTSPAEMIHELTVDWSRSVVLFVIVSEFGLSKDVLMELLRQELSAGNFSLTFNASTYHALAIRQVAVENVTPFYNNPSTNPPMFSLQLHSGFISIIAVGCVVAVVMILVAIMLAIRFCRLQSIFLPVQSIV